MIYVVWEPGNATRYELFVFYTKYPRNDGTIVVGGPAWVSSCGGGLTGAMLVMHGERLWPSRVMEKMRQKNEGDAVAMTDLIGRVLRIETVLPDWWKPTGEPEFHDA